MTWNAAPGAHVRPLAAIAVALVVFAAIALSHGAGLLYPLILLVLLGGPITGAAIIWAWRHHTRALVRLSSACVGFIRFVAVCWTTGFQTSSMSANFAFVVAAFFAWCLLASACWTLKPRFIGIVAGALAYLTLLPGYLLGPFGLLGVAFALDDDLSPPLSTAVVGPGLSCVVTGWGWAGSDEGYTIHLYRYWTAFPALRREVASVVVDESIDRGPHPTCESVAAAHGS